MPKKEKITVVILLVIVTLGIFLRSYHFNDLQRFDQDQARDVVVVDQMAKDHNLLIMGPYAGGTKFDLGPGYYYLEYATILIFGNDPASFAYSTLFFSILAIPLLFIILRKYFSDYISLSLTAVYAVSFYAVKYARFAWNPNPLPFFVLAFLWLLLKIIEDKNKKPKIIWSIFLGIVVGIGIQLHTIIILLFLPALAVFFAFYLYRKYPLRQSLMIVVLVIAFLNIPQFIHEYRTNGENTQAFIQGVILRTNYPATFEQYAVKNVECYTQGSSYMLSSKNDDSKCTLFDKNDSDSIHYFSNLILTLALFLGGIFLMFFYLKKEKDPRKREFLALSAFYIVLSFLVFLAFAYGVDIRYFIVVFFLPFFLLGFWLKFLTEKFKLVGIIFSSLLIIFLLAINIIPVKKTYFSGLNPNYAGGGNFGGLDLKDAKLIAQFIWTASARLQVKNIYLDGSQTKYFKTMKYFLSQKSDFNATRKKDDLPSGAIIFSILDDPKQNKTYNDNLIYTRLDFVRIDGYDVFMLQKK